MFSKFFQVNDAQTVANISNVSDGNMMEPECGDAENDANDQDDDVVIVMENLLGTNQAILMIL